MKKDNYYTSSAKGQYYQINEANIQDAPTNSLFIIEDNSHSQPTYQQTLSTSKRVEIDKTSPATLTPVFFYRSFETDELYGPADIPTWASWWIKIRWGLVAYLFIQPFLLFDLQTIYNCSFVAFMSFFAGCIPSSGTPVAGGIVFIPVLKMCGVTPSSSVAFCAVIQSVGCGISNPLNWYSKDPSVLIGTTYIYTLPASIVGLLLAIFYFPIHDTTVDFYFTIFCVFLLGTVVYGLNNTLHTQDKPVIFPSIMTKEGMITVIVYTCTMLLGGLLAGWIGIGLEKLFFTVVTTYHQADCKRATVTAIALIGWLSWVSAIFHIFYKQDVPYDYVICSLPLTLLGTFAGPCINQMLGSKNILIIFCVFLCLTIVEELRKAFYI